MPFFQLLNATDIVTTLEKNEIVNFLHDNMEGYSNHNKEVILKCIEYALSKFPHQGGFLVLAKEGHDILGAVVVNKTNMEDYIPENVLVYLAVQKDNRKQGLGTALIQKAIEYTKGGLATHLPPDNPYQSLFEKLGFSFQYKEYRLEK